MSNVSQFTSKRKSITFVPSSVKAINELVELTGDTDTDVVNKSVQVWAFIKKQTCSGKTLKLVDDETGATETVHIV